MPGTIRRGPWNSGSAPLEHESELTGTDWRGPITAVAAGDPEGLGPPPAPSTAACRGTRPVAKDPGRWAGCRGLLATEPCLPARRRRGEGPRRSSRKPFPSPMRTRCSPIRPHSSVQQAARGAIPETGISIAGEAVRAKSPACRCERSDVSRAPRQVVDVPDRVSELRNVVPPPVGPGFARSRSMPGSAHTLRKARGPVSSS